MITLIGIDCAVAPRKRGIARGRIDGGVCRVDAVWRGDQVDLVELVTVALGDGPVVLALDAPLGWPAALGDRLVDHRAGQRLESTADAMFRRETDRLIASRLGKTPLDVGADRIARTAHAALGQFAELADALGMAEIPLLWQPSRPPRLSALEVYPAGLLVAAGSPVVSGYKPVSARTERRAILDHLAGEMVLDAAAEDAAIGQADLLDAALCVLAGADVLAGRAVAPRRGRERQLAGREGWIWVRSGNG